MNVKLYTIIFKEDAPTEDAGCLETLERMVVVNEIDMYVVVP